MGNKMETQVSVFVATYNHKDYIAQALDSILAQEVTFPYEIVIHDDASTDGTTEIIKAYEKQYPDIIKCVCESDNQFSQGNLVPIWDCHLYMCTGKYCAILDGDDYWSDSKKLQIQYDFMEAHPECSLYMHNAWRLDVQMGDKVLLDTFPRTGYYSQREQVLCGLGSKFPATGSYFFIMDYLRKDFPSFVIDAGVGDYPIRQIVANKGMVYYDERPMSVYRYMTRGSFMKRIRDDLGAYVKYITKICYFYQQIDEYLGNRFSDIYSKKIDSDILGLAAATYCYKEEVLNTDDGWLINKLNSCYEMLAGSQWIQLVKKQLEKASGIWIYGTSMLGAICKRSLEQSGIKVKGFVVSDGYSKSDTYEKCPVRYISETTGQNNFYIVAAQPINQNSIEQVLIAHGEKGYYAPFVMEKIDT